MSDKIIPIPLLAIRSRRIRDDLDGLISRKREIKSTISSIILEDGTPLTDLLKEEKQIDDDLTALYIKNDFHKIVFPDGTSATKCTIPRTTIIKEKLLTHPKLVKHIDLEVIAECSETTESKPFIKVTFKKDQKGESK